MQEGFYSRGLGGPGKRGGKRRDRERKIEREEVGVEGERTESEERDQ